MCQLVESIKLKDGIILNLEYHQNRMNRSMAEWYPKAETIPLASAISVPADCASGVYKVRVLYRETIEKIEITPYLFRSVKNLKIVHHETIDYHLKYTDRQILQELYAQRGICDDIIIVKNGLVTDSFAANLLFFDGKKWITPTTPLLKGTQRQFLLDRGIISEKEIREEEVKTFQKVSLINAMIGFEEMPVIATSQVWY
jgi:4-amino-4-deoxychorismate lyase